MFPLSIEGKMNTLYTKAELVIERLVPALIAGGAKNVRSDSNSIDFDGGFQRNVVVGMMGRSRLIFDDGVLRYKCSMQLVLAVAGFMAAVIAVIIIVMPNVHWALKIAIPIGAWLWLFGMNYFLTTFRFRRLLRWALSHEHR